TLVSAGGTRTTLLLLERFQAKWIPVCVKKTRQIKNLGPRFDSIETEKALQLLQAANQGRHRRVRKTGAPIGDTDFADINRAFGVERDTVRREEFAGFKARAVLAAKPRDTLALGVDDGQARA